jgi:hypothetical protein
MSNHGSGKNVALNWRGPLLAAGIFAAVFAMLLIMAHQNESETSDMGSSLRDDPYGASLLFDSYGRAGYRITRGQDEESLSEQDPAKTTAFFIGGFSRNDWVMDDGNLQAEGKLRGRLESFLARGGRVILVAPSWELKSQSQGWEVGNIWDIRADKDADKGKDISPWVSPDTQAMPAGSEKMYVSADGARLQTDTQWTPLYSRNVETNGKPGSSARVYMATRRAGNGELIAASQESFLLNETIKTYPNPVLLDFLAGGRPMIWIDETMHGLHQNQGVLWLVQRYRLQVALVFFWSTLLALLWSMSGDLVRRPTQNPSAQVVRHGEIAGVAARRLLQRSVAKEHVVAECWEQFRRGWPQDAQAISADPAWGARLRTALTQTPLAGYRELGKLIAERRTYAKGLGHAKSDASENSAHNWL